MIGSLLLLPASLLAAQITISGVSAEREGRRVTITVKGDAMIDPEATSAKLGEGRLYLFVRDARVHEANRAWKNGVSDDAEEIRAHRHRQKVELAVPLGDGGCQGPVEIEKAPGGLRALVGCDGAPRPIAARLSRPKAEAKPEVKLDPRPAASPIPSPAAVEAKPVVSPMAAQRLSEHDAAALRAKLALDAVETAPSPSPSGVPAPKPADKIIAARPAAAVAPAFPAVFPPVLAHDKVAPVAEARPSDAPGGGGGSGGIVFAGCALLAIAGAAFFFSRGRAVRSRHIQILETASLGPKRALIVARVGDATMILSSSEAGITLLQAMPDPDAPHSQGGTGTRPPADRLADRFADLPAALPLGVPSALGTPSAPAGPPAAAAANRAGKIVVEEPAPGAASTAPAPAGWALDAYGVPAADEEVDVDDITAMADITDIADARSIGQDGLLARLFKRRKPANDALLPRFEDILEDSFEDQELRRKLALGLPGRVR